MKKTIKINNQKLFDGEKIIIMGLTEDNRVKMHIEGKIGFEEALDVINTCTYEILDTFLKMIPGWEKHPEYKDQIYTRAVQGFSLMIDKFDPEKKNQKFAGLTDEAIMKAQNEILIERMGKKK